MSEYTKFIEVDMYQSDYAWECENCKETFYFDIGGPEENNHFYCPNCGKKIAEFIPYEEECEEAENVDN